MVAAAPSVGEGPEARPVRANVLLDGETDKLALAEFANAGLVGSDAGTSLKTMLLALANPTTQTKSLMADLGISFYDATGKPWTEGHLLRNPE